MTWKKQREPSEGSSTGSSRGTNRKRPGEPKEIDGVFIFFGKDETGDEGIAAHLSPMGMMPMIFTKRSLLVKAGEMAQFLADNSGEVIRCVRFERARLVQEYHPKKDGTTR